MQTPQAIIILGRGVNEDGTLPPDPKARVETGVKLLETYPTAFLVVSSKWSFHLNTPPAKTEAQAMAEYAKTLGVTQEKIILEEASVDTLSNAYYIKTLVLIPRRWHTITVVSSPDHMERVQYIFKHVLGPDYAIEFKESPLRISPDEVPAMEKKERRSLWGAQRLLKDITPGDHEKIFSDVLVPYIPGIGPDLTQTKHNIQALAQEYEDFLHQIS